MLRLDERPAPVPASPCQHRWRIETPSGSPTSTGICRRCGVTRQFLNAFEDILGAQEEERRQANGRGS